MFYLDINGMISRISFSVQISFVQNDNLQGIVSSAFSGILEERSCCVYVYERDSGIEP